VRVEHVESEGVSETPEVGSQLTVRAFVSLGELTPDDVDVQLVHGSLGAEDELRDAVADSLTLAEDYEGGRHRFDGTVALDHSGAFGYTVRVVPRNQRVVSVAELGLVALPS
jgi:starch phosphorylase